MLNPRASSTKSVAELATSLFHQQTPTSWQRLSTFDFGINQWNCMTWVMALSLQPRHFWVGTVSQSSMTVDLHQSWSKFLSALRSNSNSSKSTPISENQIPTEGQVEGSSASENITSTVFSPRMSLVTIFLVLVFWLLAVILGMNKCLDLLLKIVYTLWRGDCWAIWWMKELLAYWSPIPSLPSCVSIVVNISDL